MNTQTAPSHPSAANDWFCDHAASTDERFEHTPLWIHLRTGNLIEIRSRHDDRPVLSGTVDDRMRDGSAIWILTDDMRRLLVHVSEDVDIWRRVISN
jgi:hypothetical protein